MKINLIILCFVLVSAIMLCNGASASTNTPVCINNAQQSEPAISGNTIIWTDQRNNYRVSGNYNPDIYMKDLKTGQTIPVCTNTEIQQFPKVSGNHIVWQDGRNGYDTIYTKDIVYTSTGVTVQNERILSKPKDNIGSTAYHQMYPDISGNKVVWEDNRRGPWDIYMYDFITKTEKRISSNAAKPTEASISGNIIAWIDNRYKTWGDIYMYDLSTHTEKRVTSISGYCGNPKISDNYIIYDNDLDLYSYNIKTYKTIKQVASTTQYSISGYKIAYSKWNYYGTSYTQDIFVKDILYGITTPICLNSHTQENPAINGIKVVWEDWRNGNKDIYMSYIPLTIFKVDPPNGATGVARDKMITITFSIPVKWGTYYIEVLKNGVAVPSTVFTKSLNSNGLSLNIKPVTLWAANTKYTVVLHTGCVKDITGNNLALTTRSFTTTTDAVSPTIKTPLSGTTTNIARTQSMTITFSETVKWATKWIEIKANGVTVPTSAYTMSLSSDGKTLTIKPVTGTLWKANTTYNVIFHTGCVKDIAGNSLALVSRGFKTGST